MKRQPAFFELLMRTADLSHPDNIISRTAIDGLDLIVSNDPHEQLKTAMLHAPDGRLRLGMFCNIHFS